MTLSDKELEAIQKLIDNPPCGYSSLLRRVIVPRLLKSLKYSRDINRDLWKEIKVKELK